MTGRERTELAELKVWMFGEDGTGGAIGELRGDVSTLKTDMSFLKGAVKLAAFALTFVGLSGIGWFLVSVAQAASK